jgi:hypothetical protein
MNGFDVNLITQFGVAGLIFAAFMFLLKWVLKTQDRILSDAKEERLVAIENMRIFQKNIEQINENWRKEQEQSNQYIDHARAEHNKIMESTTNACNHLIEFRKEMIDVNDARRREHERIIANLDEQTKILVRINGFKHE